MRPLTKFDTLPPGKRNNASLDKIFKMLFLTLKRAPGEKQGLLDQYYVKNNWLSVTAGSDPDNRLSF